MGLFDNPFIDKPIPDYETTFEVWSSFPVEVDEVVDDCKVIEVLPPISTSFDEPFPPGRFIGELVEGDDKGWG